MIASRKKNSDSQDNNQRTINCPFDKQPFFINDKDITENLNGLISNQKQKNESYAQKDFHEKQQSNKQSQLSDINKVETVVTSRDHPDTGPNETYSKITEENISKTFTCENLENEGYKTENKETTEYPSVHHTVISIKEVMETYVIKSKHTKLASWNEGDHSFNTMQLDDYNLSQYNGALNIVIYMPLQKFEELCPSFKVSSKMGAKYNYSNIDKQYTSDLLYYFINCIDPGPPNKTTKTLPKAQSDKNKIKEHILEQHEIISSRGTIRAVTPNKKKIVQDAARQKLHKLTNMQPSNESTKIHEIKSIDKTLQTIAHNEVISPNKRQVVPTNKLLNSSPPLRELPMPQTQKDGLIDLSKGFPEQIAWAPPEKETEQQQNLPSKTQRFNWNMWEHPFVPTPNNRDSSFDMSNTQNAETHKEFVTPTAAIPQQTLNNEFNNMSARSQPHHLQWHAPVETQMHEWSSAFPTETQHHQPSHHLYANHYQYSNQIGPVGTHLPNTSNSAGNLTRENIAHDQVWNYGPYPSGMHYHMNRPNQMWMQQHMNQTSKQNVQIPDNVPEKNLAHLIQPGTACDSPQFQQNIAQNINPASALQFPQCYTHDMKLNPQSYWSSQFQQETSQSVKQEPNQNLNAESEGSPQLQQTCAQPASDSKTSDDVPLSEVMKIVKLRVQRALKHLSAEEQIKSLNMSNECGNKKPPKCPPKQCVSKTPPPTNCASKICPPPPEPPPCPSPKKCPDPLPRKKKCDPCIK